MLDDGTGGDAVAPPRPSLDGAADVRARAGELRLRLRATRARPAQLRRSGLDGNGRPADGPDGFEQVQDQLQSARERIGHLETALASNRRIGMAIGIVMVTHRITDEEAFTLLREQSQVRNRKLRDVAEEVIYTGTL